MKKNLLRTLAAVTVAAGTATVFAVSFGAPAPAPASAASATWRVPRNTIVVPLTPQPVGTAKLAIGPTGQVTARLDLTGLAPGTAHTVDVDPGGCSAGETPILSFPAVTADGVGNIATTVTSTQTVHGSLPTDATFAIRTGSDTGPDADKPIGCAQLPWSWTQTADLRIQPQSDELAPLWGQATLTYDASQKTLKLQVRAAGLAPFSQHAAHIHSGSCTSQGPVLYMIPTLFADAHGLIDTTDTITGVTSPPPASGWYVNLHLGNMSQILTAAGNPTILFRPLLCGNIAG